MRRDHQTLASITYIKTSQIDDHRLKNLSELVVAYAERLIYRRVTLIIFFLRKLLFSLRYGLEWLGVAWSGLEWAWSGLEWLEVARSGLEWLGVDPSKRCLIFLSEVYSRKWLGVGSSEWRIPRSID